MYSMGLFIPCMTEDSETMMNQVAAIAVVAVLMFHNVIHAVLISSLNKLHALLVHNIVYTKGTGCSGGFGQVERTPSIATVSSANREYDGNEDSRKDIGAERFLSSNIVLENDREFFGCPSDHAVHEDEMTHSFSVEEIFITEVVRTMQDSEDKRNTGTNSRAVNMPSSRTKCDQSGYATDDESLDLESLLHNELEESLTNSSSSLRSGSFESNMHGSNVARAVSLKLKDKIQRQQSSRSVLRSQLNEYPLRPGRCESSKSSHCTQHKELIAFGNSCGNVSHGTAHAAKRSPTRSSVQRQRERGNLSRQLSHRSTRSSIHNLCHSDQVILQRLNLSGAKLNFDSAE